LKSNDYPIFVFLLIFFLPNSDSQKLTGIRQLVVSNWLEYCEVLSEFFDPEFRFEELPFANIAAGDRYSAGVAPESIKEPEIRKDYEERLAKNAQYALEFRFQHKLKNLLPQTLEESREFFIKAYSHIPRADEELVELLEQYQYPEAEKIKILKALNIAYKGFREWQTTDGLFSPTAKLIAIDQGDVKLEKADGKRITIEFSALRKEDQDYVKEQIEAKPAPIAMRTWTSSSGKYRIQAEYVSADENQVILKSEAGKIFPVAFSKLSKEDLDYVNKQLEAKPELPKRGK
jgi:hypothetical protein